MKYRLAFTSGAWRTLEADGFTESNNLLVFVKDDKPVLTAVTANLCFFEPAPPEPARTFDRGDLFTAWAR